MNAAYTLQLDRDNKAIRVTDSKLRARDLFIGHNQLPKPGGSNPLKEAWNGGYAVEIFYFPASSLKITNILRYFAGAPPSTLEGRWGTSHHTRNSVFPFALSFAHSQLLGGQMLLLQRQEAVLIGRLVQWVSWTTPSPWPRSYAISLNGVLLSQHGV